MLDFYTYARHSVDVRLDSETPSSKSARPRLSEDKREGKYCDMLIASSLNSKGTA